MFAFVAWTICIILVFSSKSFMVSVLTFNVFWICFCYYRVNMYILTQSRKRHLFMKIWQIKKQFKYGLCSKKWKAKKPFEAFLVIPFNSVDLHVFWRNLVWNRKRHSTGLNSIIWQFGRLRTHIMILNKGRKLFEPEPNSGSYPVSPCSHQFLLGLLRQKHVFQLDEL